MSKIITLPEIEYFGACPKCRRHDGFLDGLDGSNWFVCHKHRVKWCVGVNLLSANHSLAPEQLAEQARVLATYRAIEPLDPPLDEVTPRGNRSRREIVPILMSTARKYLSIYGLRVLLPPSRAAHGLISQRHQARVWIRG